MNLFKSILEKSKKKKQIVSGIPEEISYNNLLNYVFRLGSTISRSELDWIIEDKRVAATLDGNTKQRLIAFHHYFKAEWQKAMDQALPLATTEPYDQDMVGLASAIWNNAGQYKDSLQLIEKCADEARIESKEIYYVQRGSTAWCAGNEAQALEYLKKALEINPENLQAIGNLCGVFNQTGKPEEAKALRKQLLELSPDSPDTLFNEGIYKLADGDFAEGLALYEYRYAAELAQKYFRNETLHRPRWDGGNLDNKRLYIYFEQGLGDTLMTCRYLKAPEFSKCHVIAECQPEAKDLLQDTFPNIEWFYKPATERIDIEFDCWIGSMSLPYLLHPTTSMPPYREGYLKPKEFISSRSPFLQESSPRIGISWSGNPAHTNDPRRSIPWKQAKAFIEASGCTLYAMQTKIPEDKPDNLIDISEYLITLTDTAEFVSQLDLVITVDTSLVHLAGALGKQTWLLCHQAPEWRWGASEGVTRWYASVSMFRQSEPGQWEELLNKVMLDKLKNFLGEVH